MEASLYRALYKGSEKAKCSEQSKLAPTDRNLQAKKLLKLVLNFCDYETVTLELKNKFLLLLLLLSVCFQAVKGI